MKDTLDQILQKVKEIREKIPNERRYNLIIAFGVLSFVFLLFSDNSEQKVIYKTQKSIDYSNSRILNNARNIYKRKEKVLSNDMRELQDLYKKSSQDFKEQIKVLSEEIKRIKEDKKDKSSNHKLPLDSSFNNNHLKTETITVEEKSKGSKKQQNRRKNYIRNNQRLRVSKGPSIISFPVKSKAMELDQVVIPSGSFLKAKLLIGVQATESKAVPSLLLAEEAFIGPNRTRIDLTGCFLIAKSSGNLSIERVEMQTTKISCVSKSGKMFERKLNGFVADQQDSSFALKGELKSRQGRTAALGFLSSIVEGVGKAVQQAQTTQTTNATGGINTMISGDQGKYLLAGGASNAASRVTNWYLKQAEGLLPHIEVKAAQSLYVITQDTVNLPNWYFKQNNKGKSHDYSYLSTILN